MKRRTERIAEAVRRLASEAIYTQLRDPRVAGFITVTRVEVTPDLRFAKIYYSVLGDEKKKKRVRAGLKSAKGFMRRFIGDALGLRYTLDILFKIDESAEYSGRIDEILNELHKEKDHEQDK